MIRVFSQRTGLTPGSSGPASRGTPPEPRLTTQWSKAVAPAAHLRYVRGVELDWVDIELALSSLGLEWTYAPHKPHDQRLQLQTTHFEIHHSGGHTLVQGRHGWKRASLDAIFLRLRSRVAIRKRALPPLEPERA